MAIKTVLSAFLFAMVGLASQGCYSPVSTEGLACLQDDACNPGQFCHYSQQCRVACTLTAASTECALEPEGYGCWEDPDSPYGGACLPCATACDATCCAADWVCATGFNHCCPWWEPYVCPNGACAESVEQCPAV